MANENRGKFFNFIFSNFPGVTVVLILIFLVVPMNKFVIDLCMIVNLAFSFVVLLSVLYTPRASDFQTFPRIILIQTLFSLAINISSTVLILTGKPQNIASEQSVMVQAFANIVAGNNEIVGFIIFIILVLVQAMVITKGASRISEVAARFSLDSMSQKFFDVDNRLNSGAIDDQEALRLKDAIRREIDFYSNMDGASKFVGGNVKLGIIITIINLVGGVIIGNIDGKMSFSAILSSYSHLTIGDGLMSQMPSLIISFATGLLVTGNKSDEPLGEQLTSDFSRSGNIYEIVGAVLIIVGIALRNGTQYLCVPLGVLFIFIGYRLSQSKQKEKEEMEQKARDGSTSQAKLVADEAEKISMLDPLSLELGYALIPLVSKEKGAELLERISRIRNEAKLDMGFVIPKIHIQDNMTLDPNDYSFKIKGIEAGRANIRLGYYMCLDNGTVVNKLQGEKTKDPAFGMDAIWLPEDQRSEAMDAGYVVIDPPTIIATHLTEIIKDHAAEMLGRDEVAAILDTVKSKNSVLVDEVLNTAKLTYGQIQAVLQNLLAERVSIRNIVTILETMANYANVAHGDTWALTEKVREALGLQICMQYADPDDKKLRVFRLSQGWSEKVQQYAQVPMDGSAPFVGFDPVDYRKWISNVSSVIAKANEKGYQPIILCPSQIRQFVKSLLATNMPIVVISENEIMAANKYVSPEVIDEIKLDDE